MPSSNCGGVADEQWIAHTSGVLRVLLKRIFSLVQQLAYMAALFITLQPRLAVVPEGQVSVYSCRAGFSASIGPDGFETTGPEETQRNYC